MSDLELDDPVWSNDYMIKTRIKKVGLKNLYTKLREISCLETKLQKENDFKDIYLLALKAGLKQSREIISKLANIGRSVKNNHEQKEKIEELNHS